MAMSPTLLRPRRRVAVPPPEGSAPSAPTGINLTTAPLVPTALTLTTAPSPPTGVTMDTGLVAPTNVGLLAAPKNLAVTEVFTPDSPTGLALTAAPASPTGVQLSAVPSEPASVTVASAPSSPTGVGLLGAPTNVAVTESAATDTYFSDVVLLLQDSLTDESPQGQTVATQGGVTLSSAVAKVGTSSIDLSTASARGLSFGLATSDYKWLHDKTTDYTIEAWLYPTINTSRRVIAASNAASASSGVLLELSGGDVHYSIYRSVSGSFINAATPNPLPLNQWSHVAVVVTTSTVSIYVDGNLEVSTPWSLAGSSANSSQPFTIGYADPSFSGAADFDGYIDALRITKAARYTTNFTPPTSAFPATNGDPDFANVSLLLQDSLTDESPQGQTITALGGASFTTTNPKVGTHSLSLSGGSDRLTLSPGPGFAYGDGDFCVEAWFYQTGTVAFGSPLFAQTESGENYFNVRAGFSNPMQTKIDVRVNNQQLVSTATYTLNSWHHVAVVRQSGVVTIYLDGQAVGSATMSSALNNTSYTPTVGALSNNALNFIGYIDALRITKAARYTTNFTPPTSAFPS